MSLQTTLHYSPYNSKPSVGVGMWTEEEHARFLEGVKIFSNGPWKRVATYVGTRNVRQTMTHAQKYRLKAARRLREAQRKQAAARHGLHSTQRSVVKSPLARSPDTPPSGLGSCSKMRVPCTCTEKDCEHTEEESKIYMTIADAIEILDSKSRADSQVSIDDITFLSIGKMEAFYMEQMTPMDATGSDSGEFPTLEDCASELLELLF